MKYISVNLPNILVWLGSGIKKSDIKSDVTSTTPWRDVAWCSWLLPVLSFPLWHCEVGYTDSGQVSLPQFGAVKTGVHALLDSFSCQHEKLSIKLSTWPKNILPVSYISSKAEYLVTWIKSDYQHLHYFYYCYYYYYYYHYYYFFFFTERPLLLI